MTLVHRVMYAVTTAICMLASSLENDFMTAMVGSSPRWTRDPLCSRMTLTSSTSFGLGRPPHVLFLLSHQCVADKVVCSSHVKTG